MNYETLNENCLLVELTCEEMKQLHITYESLDSNSELCENAVRKILKEISRDKIKPNNKITVEALPTNDGGCFFIFTFSEKKHRYKVKKPCNDIFFYTDNLNGLLDSISSAQRLNGHKAPCRVFKMNDNFYLYLSQNHKHLHPIFKEFGSITNSFSKEMLNEHGVFMGEVVI